VIVGNIALIETKVVRQCLGETVRVGIELALLVRDDSTRDTVSPWK